MSTSWVAMPLLRASQPFDHPDWMFELKHDGFRALAIIEQHDCRLVSRQGHEFWQWPQLAEERRVRSESIEQCSTARSYVSGETAPATSTP